MNKTELNKALIAGLTDLGASQEAIDFVDGLTKPKVGGGSSDVADYTVFNEAEEVTHVFCTYHKKWEPVSALVMDEETGEEIEEALFKENPKAKNGLARECNEGLSTWKEQAKVYKSTKDAIISDLLEGAVDNETAKGLIAEADAARAEHPERLDGLGSDERPEA